MAKTVGIDLGTTNSVIAYMDTTVRTITGADNQELCRSCVALDKKTNEFIIGNSAYRNWAKYAPNVVVSVKRLMGGSIGDEQVQKMKSLKNVYPYGIDKLAGGTEESVAVILNGKQYTPEQISSKILAQMVKDASIKIGEITHAVITVPAYFNEKQKTATRKAAELAGLKVQRLLAEPTAAAISYGADKMAKDEEKVFLVYDFGGGTFDLSILVASGGNFIESGSGGDRWLGGDDIDRKLFEYVLSTVNKENHVDVEKLISALPDRKKNKFQGELKAQVERAKLQLSSSNSAPIAIYGDLETEDGDIIDIDVTITRDEFNNLIRPIVQRTIDLTDELLDKTGYPIEAIDNILLVGGSSCIPLVRTMLSEKYGKDKVLSSEKPMLAVAEGAAILAHSLSDEYECPNCGQMVSKDVTTCPHCGCSLDAHGIDGDGEEPPILVTYTSKHDFFIQLVSGPQKIINAQEPLPCEVNKKFKTTVDNQKIVEVVLLNDAEDGKFDKISTGYFTIPDNLPKDSTLTFTFYLSEDETMSVKVKIDKTGKSKDIVLGRGNKDTKCFDTISSSVRKILADDSITDDKKEEYMAKIQECIENISNNHYDADADKWQDIESCVNMAETAAYQNDGNGQVPLSVILAKVLLGTFSRFIRTEDESELRNMLSKAESPTNTMEKTVALKKLETIENRYSLLTVFFMLKIVAMSPKVSPSTAAQADNAFEDIMSALNSGDVDNARNIFSINQHLLDELNGGSGIDINDIALKGL